MTACYLKEKNISHQLVIYFYSFDEYLSNPSYSITKQFNPYAAVIKIIDTH